MRRAWEVQFKIMKSKRKEAGKLASETEQYVEKLKSPAWPEEEFVFKNKRLVEEENRMKRTMTIGLAALLIILAGAFVALAGNKMGPGSGVCASAVGTGTCPNGDCTGPILACSGVMETITGTVESLGIPGGGLVVKTDASTETLYGIGPFWYWERNGIDRPEIGEAVTVEAESVTIGSTTEKVIVSITIGDQKLALRDGATCLPLWRGKRR